MTARVVGDLAAAGRLHDVTMAMIEASEEWRDYDAHVTFELNLLRHRYTVEGGAVAGSAMDTARRTQLQEHLRQKQAVIMAEHAEEVASEMLAVMTAEEREQLTAALWRVDAPGLAATAAGVTPTLAATTPPAAALPRHPLLGRVEGATAAAARAPSATLPGVASGAEGRVADGGGGSGAAAGTGGSRPP